MLRQPSTIITLSACIAATQASSILAQTQEHPGQRSLQRVVVVGDALDVETIPGSAYVLDKEELSKHNPTDIQRALRDVPGVYSQDEEGHGLRPNIGMRGTGVSRSSKITVMEDGVLAAPSPYSAPAAYFFPPTGKMENIEVRMGSSAIKFGPFTQGGTINLLTTSIPNENRAYALLSYGERNSEKTHAYIGGSTTHVGWLIESFRLGEDGFKKLDSGDPTGFRLTDVSGKLRLNTSPDASNYQELVIKIGQTNERSHETYLGLTKADFDSTPFRRYSASQKDIINAERQTNMVRHYYEFSPRIDLTTTLYQNHFERNWYKVDQLELDGESLRLGNIVSNPDEFATAYEILQGGTSPDGALGVKGNRRIHKSEGISTILGMEFAGDTLKHNVEFGVRYHRDEEDRKQYLDRYTMQDNTMVLVERGEPGVGRGNNQTAYAEAVATHIYDNIDYGNFTFGLGLRHESITYKKEDYGAEDPARNEKPTSSDNTVDALLPGAGVIYRFSPELSVFASAHRGFSPPGATGDSSVKPESSINTEFGVRVAQSNLLASLVAFHNAYDNLLGADTAAAGGDGSGDMHNGGKALVQGLEAQVSSDLSPLIGTGLQLPVAASFTHTRAEFRSNFEATFGDWSPRVQKGDKLPYVPQNQLSASVGVRQPQGAAVYLSGQYRDAIRTQAGSGSVRSGAHVPSYTVFDLNAQYELSSDKIIHIDVRNLTDNTYAVSSRPFGWRPGLPRTIMGGVKFTL